MAYADELKQQMQLQHERKTFEPYLLSKTEMLMNKQLLSLSALKRADGSSASSARADTATRARWAVQPRTGSTEACRTQDQARIKQGFVDRGEPPD